MDNITIKELESLSLSVGRSE